MNAIQNMVRQPGLRPYRLAFLLLATMLAMEVGYARSGVQPPNPAMASPGVSATAVMVLPTAVSPTRLPTVALPGTRLISYEELAAALRATGVQVELVPRDPSEGSEPLFAVPGRMLKVNRVEARVFVYSSEAAAQADAARISPDGWQIGNAMVDWVDLPHFYRSGQVIVEYIGGDRALMRLLEQVVGPQFAGASLDVPVPPTLPPQGSSPVATG